MRTYSPLNFEELESKFKEVQLAAAPADGIAPADFYSTTNYPTYIKHRDKVFMPREHRMDACIVKIGDVFYAREFRNIMAGELVVCGSHEDGSQGILVHDCGFNEVKSVSGEHSSFEFMSGTVSREHPIDYKNLANLLKKHAKDPRGYITWVLGPAISHARGRKDMAWLIDNGYVNALLAGNALATHDLEASIMNTTLGMDANGTPVKGGHRHHMNALNIVRTLGSIAKAVLTEIVTDGIMYACEMNEVPYVLAGSIRDDGPLPEVISNALDAQDAMRNHTKRSTMVVMIGTILHSIATGNMLPIYYELDPERKDGNETPTALYEIPTICVDIDEFVVNKLRDRGTHQSIGVVNNAQDFLRILVDELK